MRRHAAAALSAYYVVTGIWPIAHMASFEAVTGRKHDRWVVNMVGASAIANGVTLAVGLRRRPLGAKPGRGNTHAADRKGNANARIHGGSHAPSIRSPSVVHALPSTLYAKR